MPGFIRGFLVVNVALAVAYLLNRLAGEPYEALTVFLDLNNELNLPTWYASIQWFAVAAVLALFAIPSVRRATPRSWLLLALPAVFLLMSLDEVAEIHERLGHLADLLLPGGLRAGSVVSVTGLWFAVLGIPFVVGFVVLIRALVPYLAISPRGRTKLVTGVGLFLLGAVGVEVLANVVVESSVLGTLQVLTEEMLEMVGATVSLWGAWELLLDSGFAWHLEAIRPIS